MAIFAKKQDGKRKGASPPPETVTIEVPALTHFPGGVSAKVSERPHAVIAGPPEPGKAEPPAAEAPKAEPPAAQALADAPTPAPELRPQAIEPIQSATAAPVDSIEVSVAGMDDGAGGDSIDIDPEVIEPDSEFAGTPPPTPFGLADAIRLMRSLPTDANPDLVVRVVRLTLGAVDVSVEDIMQDAFLREKTLRDNLVFLRQEAAELEKHLVAKQREIAVKEGELEETSAVYERLRHAEPQASHRPPPPPPEAALNSYHNGPRPHVGS